jgi:hypothetical protein
MASSLGRAENAVWGMDDRAVEQRGQKVTPAGDIDRRYGKGRSDDVPRGIACMVVATILFSGASAASKWLVGVGALPAFIGVACRRRGGYFAGQRALGFCDASTA